RPDYRRESYATNIPRWLKFLITSKSIAQHVVIFEQDICQLIKELKEFTFLDIYGKLDYEKVEPYIV
ncbi:unnamed protein product, partial [Rotaria sp. Silwood1]